jgi:hypothetical protein
VRTLWATLLAIGILALADAIIGIAVRRQFDSGVRDYVAAGEPEGRQIIAEISSALSYNVIGGMTAATAAVLLAIALRKPRRWARTATAVALGINMLALVTFLAANPTYYAEPGPLSSRFGRALWDNLVPDWYGPTFYVLNLVMLALSVTLTVLLFRGSVRDYFSDGVREPVAADTWDPTTLAPSGGVSARR